MIQEHDYLFKVVIVGNQGVGKSSLFLRYCDQNFVENYMPTIGVDFRFRKQSVDGSLCKLQIWDTAGQEKFRTITSAYYRSSQAVLIVYDVTDQKSFREIEDYWLQEVKNNIDSDTVTIIVGNKNDLSCTVQTFVVENFAENAGLPLYFVSAKTGEGVEKMFTQLCMMLIEKQKLLKKMAQERKSKKKIKVKKSLLQEADPSRKRKCCLK